MAQNNQRRPKHPVSSGVHLWLVLWKASRSLETYARHNINRLGAGIGICQSDFAVLEALLHKGSLTVNELGAKVLLTSGSISTAVERLVVRGLVARRADEIDRRARIVVLTPRGRGVIAKLFAEHKRALDAAVSALSRRERATLVKLLRKLGLSIGQLANLQSRAALSKTGRE
jgi:MarR family transcriptional regulator, 2-MHQ and catechol-resistance regulon repressor